MAHQQRALYHSIEVIQYVSCYTWNDIQYISMIYFVSFSSEYLDTYADFMGF